jgi:hypothetical protein
MDAVIIGNFDVVKRNTSLSLTSNGIWYNYFSGDSLIVSDPQITVELKPAEFRIYTTKKLPIPEQGILTDIKTSAVEIPNNFELFQNYPNPFNPTTTIRYSIPSSSVIQSSSPNSGMGAKNKQEFSSQSSQVNEAPLSDNVSVELIVYDILGRKIKTLVNKKQNPGNYEISFDSGNLSSGIYFYTLSTGNFTATKKMILLR